MGTPTEVTAPPKPNHPSTALRDRDDAEVYVAMVCFKHGPPRLHGVELEWTVHHGSDPSRPWTQTCWAGPARLVDHLGHVQVGQQAPHCGNGSEVQVPGPFGHHRVLVGVQQRVDV